MASGVDPGPPSKPLLTLGRVDRVCVQVGHRVHPDSPPTELFLLDLPVADSGADAVTEVTVLAGLEQILYAGGDVPRHYSLHEHRWHTSWGPTAGVLDLGLQVTTGRQKPVAKQQAYNAVIDAFRELVVLAGGDTGSGLSRDAAVTRARRSISGAYGVDADELSVSTEQHDPAAGVWALTLRGPGGKRYRALVGFLDGYGGSVHVRLEPRLEVADSVGAE